MIEPHGSAFDLKLRELWRYRDLIYLFVHRDFVAQYKQTILGPAWHFIQPLLTTIIFTIVFGKIAKIPTDGVPPFLFYMAGTVIWIYFSTGAYGDIQYFYCQCRNIWESLFSAAGDTGFKLDFPVNQLFHPVFILSVLLGLLRLAGRGTTSKFVDTGNAASALDDGGARARTGSNRLSSDHAVPGSDRIDQLWGAVADVCQPDHLSVVGFTRKMAVLGAV